MNPEALAQLKASMLDRAKIWLVWIAVTTIGYAIGYFGFTLFDSALAWGLPNWELQAPYLTPELSILIDLVKRILTGGLLTGIISGTQVMFLRYYIRSGSQWVVVSLVASLISLATRIAVQHLLQLTGLSLARSVVDGIVDGLAFGALQGWFLARNYRLATWWLLASLDAQGLAALLSFAIIKLVYFPASDTLAASSNPYPNLWDWYRLLVPLNTALGASRGLITGCLTGLGLVLLLSRIKLDVGDQP